MTFEVGAALDDAKWQAPVYCFDKNTSAKDSITSISADRLGDGVLKGSTVF